MYISDIKNLVFGSFLNKHEFKMMFEYDKFILIKNERFVDRRFATFEMFKLNIINGMPSTSAYLIESCNLWHDRLGHFHYNKIKHMANIELITNLNNGISDKCITCSKCKVTHSLFMSVQISLNVLDLIHTNICEMTDIVSRGGKRYFITFIDDASKYTYVFLLRTIDKAFEKFKTCKA